MGGRGGTKGKVRNNNAQRLQLCEKTMEQADKSIKDEASSFELDSWALSKPK